MSSMSSVTSALTNGQSHEMNSDDQKGKLVITTDSRRNLGDYFVPILNNDEVKNMETLLTEWVVDSSQEINVVNRPSFQRFVDSIRPNTSLLLRERKKPQRMVNMAAASAKQNFRERIQEGINSGRRVGFTIDGWSGVNKEHIDGIMVKIGREIFPLSVETVGTDHDGMAVARGWEDALERSGYVYSYFCSGNAGQRRRARNILGLRHPSVLFTCCWAHQLNLMVKHLLQVHQFASVTKKAVAAANALNASSSKWLPKLKTILPTVYGRLHNMATTMHTMAETRWNSIQACFASQLRIKRGLKVFYAHHGNELPNALRVFDDVEYWIEVEEAELAIRPFCHASFLLQRTVATMAHVMFALLCLTNHILEYEGCHRLSNYSNDLLHDIDTRWKAVEQPLYFLCFAGHPFFRSSAVAIVSQSSVKNGNWMDDRNPLSYERLCHAARFYYRKFNLYYDAESVDGRKKESDRLSKQLKRYLKEPSYLSMEFSRDEDPYSWWEYHRDEVKEITRFFQYLLDAPVQSADVERLFKRFADVLTTERNRMNPETMFGVACVKEEMKRKYKSFQPKSMNRYVDPTEFESNVVLGQPLQTEDDDAGVAKKENGQKDDDDDEPAEEEETPAVAELLGPEEGEIDFLTKALAYFDDGDSDIDENTDFGNVTADDDEDSPEQPPDSLQPLPTVNVRDYPQENAAYLQGKKYCRNDKYALRSMVDGEIQLPDLMAAFEW